MTLTVPVCAVTTMHTPSPLISVEYMDILSAHRDPEGVILVREL